MEKQNIFIFFRAYNDLDHSTPLIYLLSKNRPDLNIVLCTFLNKFELGNNNHNLFFLKNKLGMKIKYLNNEHKNFGYFLNWLLYKAKLLDFNSSIITKIVSKIVILLNKLSLFVNKKKINQNIQQIFKKYNPKYIFSDYLYPDDEPFKFVNRQRKKKYFKLIQVPHGMNVFLDMAIDKRKIKYHRNYIKNLEAKKLYYDFTITNSENDFEKLCKIGVNKDKIYNLGSLRFEKSWLKILSNIDNSNKKIKINKNKPIILILLNKLIYKGSAENIRKLIYEASQFGSVLVKPHTRNMKVGFIKDLIKEDNIILVKNYNTSYLIKISDLIIFWGTSMGVEAVLKKKRVIYAKFAHQLETVYEKFLKKFTANDVREFKILIKKIFEHESKNDQKLLELFNYTFSNGGGNINSRKLYLDFLNRIVN